MSDPFALILVSTGITAHLGWMAWLSKTVYDIRATQASHVGETKVTLQDHEERHNAMEALHPRRGFTPTTSY
jgi:hypothetical protein